MELVDYRADFDNAVATAAEADGDYSANSFLRIAADRLAEAQEVTDLNPEHFEGVGSSNRKIRLDGLAVDEADGSIVLLIGDYRPENDTGRLTPADAKKLFLAVQYFVEDSLSGRLRSSLEPSSEAFRTAEHLKRVLPTATRIRIYLVTNAQMSDRIKDFPPGRLGETVVSYHIWDIARFFQAHEAVNGREDLVVDMEQWVPGGLPCLRGGTTAGGFQTYLAVIPGAVLAGIFAQFGSRLLEGNVRSFLSTRGKVNKQMRGTLAQEPGYFLAFNNGLTTTASDIELHSSNGEQRITSISDLQIVNGGQTTASLAAYVRESSATTLDDVFVQMKIVVVDPAQYESLVPNIARYANSQNQVNDADFFANSGFHRRLEELSRRLLAPARLGTQVETRWFYERARGQYLNEKTKLSLADRKKFELQHPRAQLLTKTDVAKYAFSWEMRPHDVGLGSQKNFTKFATQAQRAWETTPDAINEQYFRETVGKAILFNSVRKRVAEQDWYESGGYLANLTSYSVAKLAQLVGERGGKELDWAALWTNQAVSEPLLRQIDLIAVAARDVLMSKNRGVFNVSEWAKKEECWAQLKAVEIALLREFESELGDSSDRKAAVIDAKKVQKIDSGIEAQRGAMAISQTKWRTIRDAVESKSILAPNDYSALRLVTGEVRGAVPEPFQAIRLLEIHRKAVQFGIVPSE